MWLRSLLIARRLLEAAASVVVDTLIAHCSLLIAHCSLLILHCSLFPGLQPELHSPTSPTSSTSSTDFQLEDFLLYVDCHFIWAKPHGPSEAVLSLYNAVLKKKSD
jgi:hypothetical protein